MTFPFNKHAARRYQASIEAHELSRGDSVPLQSAMAKEQETVLRMRVVGLLGVKRAARTRSLRLVDRKARIRLSLGIPEPSVRETWVRNSSEEPQDSDTSGEDEPLVRRVAARFDDPSLHERHSLSEGSEEDSELDVPEGPIGSVSAGGSDCGEDSSYEEERDLTSEEEVEEKKMT